MGLRVCVQIPGRARDFLFSKLFRPALRLTQPAIKGLNEYQGSFPEIKWLGFEVEHPTLTSAEVRNELS
jgi:hypothetical protein